MKTLTGSIAIAVLALTAFTNASARDCPAVCWIDVRVVDDGKGGKKLEIEDDGNAKMPKKFRWVAIIWTLKTDGYEFRNDGIVPHTGRPIPGKDTTTQGTWDRQITRGSSGRWDQFYVWNLNSDRVTMYYDVKVYPYDGGAPITLDPAIVNDP